VEEEGDIVAPSTDPPEIIPGRWKYLCLWPVRSDDGYDDGDDELATVPDGTGEVKTTASVEAPKLPTPVPSSSKSSLPSDEEINVILNVSLNVNDCDGMGDNQE